MVPELVKRVGPRKMVVLLDDERRVCPGVLDPIPAAVPSRLRVESQLLAPISDPFCTNSVPETVKAWSLEHGQRWKSPVVRGDSRP